MILNGSAAGVLETLMASLFSHAIAGAALGQAGKKQWRSDWRFWACAVVCSAIPDIDVIGFRFGIHYGDLWGHRGMTHSLLFAGIIAIVAVSLLRRSQDRRYLAFLFFLIAASHGILDALTSGGLGVAFFSPIDPHRYFFPWHAIRVSPIGVGCFFSLRGVAVLKSEFIWIWLPAGAVTAIFWLCRGSRKPVPVPVRNEEGL
jgi:inner membrane protein